MFLYALDNNLYINKCFTMIASRLRSAWERGNRAVQNQRGHDRARQKARRHWGGRRYRPLHMTMNGQPAPAVGRCKLTTALQLYFWQPPQHLANENTAFCVPRWLLPTIYGAVTCENADHWPGSNERHVFALFLFRIFAKSANFCRRRCTHVANVAEKCVINWWE